MKKAESRRQTEPKLLFGQQLQRAGQSDRPARPGQRTLLIANEAIKDAVICAGWTESSSSGGMDAAFSK